MRILLASFLFIGIFSVAHSYQSDFIDNGIFTTDSSTGLDWLDLTETSGRSWEDVHYDVHDYSDREINNVFSVSDGWRLATPTEFNRLAINWAGDAPYYFHPLNGNHPRETRYDRVDYAPGTFDGLTALLNGGLGYTSIGRCASISSSSSSAVDYGLSCESDNSQLLSSFLVRTTAVPEASSMYLLAFGLLGLLGAARRKV